MTPTAAEPSSNGPFDEASPATPIAAAEPAREPRGVGDPDIPPEAPEGDDELIWWGT